MGPVHEMGMGQATALARDNVYFAGGMKSNTQMKMGNGRLCRLSFATHFLLLQKMLLRMRVFGYCHETALILRSEPIGSRREG